jgi:hypothetical protein
MELPALRRLIGSVCDTARGHRIILFGSSSLLASYPDADPTVLGVYITIDADFFIDPDDASVRYQLEERMGENNDYHQTHGYYGDFVDLRLADAFPEGWRDRLVPMPGFENVFALSPMDMAVSKVNATARSRLDKRFARREADRGLKDINTLVALIKAGLLDYTELERGVRQLDLQPALIVECGRALEEVRFMAHQAPGHTAATIKLPP